MRHHEYHCLFWNADGSFDWDSTGTVVAPWRDGPPPQLRVAVGVALAGVSPTARAMRTFELAWVVGSVAFYREV